MLRKKKKIKPDQSQALKSDVLRLLLFLGRIVIYCIFLIVSPII
jgi:hypothetical protein